MCLMRAQTPHRLRIHECHRTHTHTVSLTHSLTHALTQESAPHGVHSTRAHVTRDTTTVRVRSRFGLSRQWLQHPSPQGRHSFVPRPSLLAAHRRHYVV